MRDIRFSANLGFLWKERPFLERIAAAAAHGFEEMEFHDNAQLEDPAALKDAVAASGLPVVSLNIAGGATNGSAAIPALADEARRAIDAAVGVADMLGAGAVHVMAGNAEGPEAEAAYLASLRHALDQSPDGMMIVIEPICRLKMPQYFLSRVDQAARIIETIDHPRLRILFDCFHVAAEGDDILATFRAHAPRVGHIQIASWPDRAEPTADGALAYATLLPALRDAGYDGSFGCEYAPAGATEAGLGWRDAVRQAIG